MPKTYEAPATGKICYRTMSSDNPKPCRSDCALRDGEDCALLCLSRSAHSINFDLVDSVTEIVEALAGIKSTLSLVGQSIRR